MNLTSSALITATINSNRSQLIKRILSPNKRGAIQLPLGFNSPGNQAIATDALSIFYTALQPGSRIHRDQLAGMLVVDGRFFKLIVFVQ